MVIKYVNVFTFSIFIIFYYFLDDKPRLPVS